MEGDLGFRLQGKAHSRMWEQLAEAGKLWRQKIGSMQEKTKDGLCRKKALMEVVTQAAGLELLLRGRDSPVAGSWKMPLTHAFTISRTFHRFMQICTAICFHFPSAWRTSFNISYATDVLVINLLSFHLSKKYALFYTLHWRIFLQGNRILRWWVLFLLKI